MRTWLRRTLISTVILLGLLGLLILIPFAYVRLDCSEVRGNAARLLQPDTSSIDIPTSISDYARHEESTYLTFPEWYMVYSADEYAVFLKEHRPSQFPYFVAVGQFWHTYSCVYHLTKDRYQFNTENHVVLSVIGTSFIIENGSKSLYEKTIGRVNEWLSFGVRVEEEAYAQRVAEEYGTFLHTIPWYEFPFGEKLRGVWMETSWWGKRPLRKWERKFALSAEYGSKAVYAGVIKKATRATFEPADLEIYATVDSRSAHLVSREPRIRIVQNRDTASQIILTPRYEAFTQIMLPLLRQGVHFNDVAGNDNILVTVIAPKDWDYAEADGAQLFAMKILTNETYKRVALRLPVNLLHVIIPALEKKGITIEHLYDY